MVTPELRNRVEENWNVRGWTNILETHVTNTRWDGVDVLPGEMSWCKFAAARQFWTEDAYANSSQVEHNRRFIFPSFVPSAVAGVAAVTQPLACLPVFGGRAVLLTFAEALIDAIENGSFQKLRQLYEASLSVVVRIRSGPSVSQVLMDSLAYAEATRALKTAHAETYYEFVSKVARLDALKDVFDADGPAPHLVKELKKLGIWVRGLEIMKAQATAIFAVSKFTCHQPLAVALRLLSEKTRKLDQESLLKRICQATTKMYKDRVAASEALTFAINTIRFMLTFKQITDAELADNDLVGPIPMHWCAWRISSLSSLPLIFLPRHFELCK
jgi:hypothetical protein